MNNNFKLLIEIIKLIPFNAKLDFNWEETGWSYDEISHVLWDWGKMTPQEFLSLTHHKNVLNHFKSDSNTLFSNYSIAQKAEFPLEYELTKMDVDEEDKLEIAYEFYPTLYGEILMANSQKGICYLHFIENREEAIQNLLQYFPGAIFQKTNTLLQQNVHLFLTTNSSPLQKIPLHLKGSDFQLSVWKEVLKIKKGQFSYYGKIAKNLGKATAVSRAIGTAIGKNLIALLIPCHRVVQANGNLGGFMWGIHRKRALIAKELKEVQEEG